MFQRELGRRNQRGFAGFLEWRLFGFAVPPEIGPLELDLGYERPAVRDDENKQDRNDPEKNKCNLERHCSDRSELNGTLDIDRHQR